MMMKILMSIERSVLKFFLGRGIDADGEKEFNLGSVQSKHDALSNKMWANYGRPYGSSKQLVASVLFQNYSQNEIQGCLPTYSVSANALADVQCEKRSGIENGVGQDDKNVIRAEEGSRGYHKINGISGQPVAMIDNKEARRNSTKNMKERKYTPMHFAAWNTSTLHSVRPLRKGYRVVMTYKIFRQGEESIYQRSLPNHKLISTQVEQVISCLKEYALQYQHRLKTKKADASAPLNNYPLTFGFFCRSTYSTASVAELGGYALRGIDLAAFRAISEFFEPIICPVLLVKDLDTGVVFNFDGGSKFKAFMTSELPKYTGRTSRGAQPGDIVKLNREYPDEDVVSVGTPAIVRCAFAELGFGNLVVAGSSYGNADCGADYVYRNFAIIASAEPGRWARRRWCFLAQEKSKDPNCLFKKIGKYYPIFRNVCYYL